MDIGYVLGWIIGLYWVNTLVRTLQDTHSHSKGWVPISLLGIAVTVGATVAVPTAAIYVISGYWALFGLIPTQAFRRLVILHRQNRYRQARLMIRVMRFLHPFSDWRVTDGRIRAEQLAYEKGDTGKAIETLRALQQDKARVPPGLTIDLLLISQDWEGVRGWMEKSVPEETRRNDPTLGTNYLRALGETGELSAMVQTFARYRNPLAKAGGLGTISSIVLAFCGRTETIARLEPYWKKAFPPAVFQLWLATAELAAGDLERGRNRMQPLLAGEDRRLRRTAQRRMSRGVAIARDLLTPADDRILAQLEQEIDRSIGLFERTARGRRRAYVTYLLMAANLALFFAASLLGGVDDVETLYRLGALWPAAVLEGEWWRLGAALFLHYGWIHLLLNGFGLYILGRAVEAVLGWRRFLAIYLVSGLGSGLLIVVLTAARLLPRFAIYLGASGCIMGLIGASAVIAFRYWRKGIANAAMLVNIAVVVGAQIAFDVLTPEVSSIGHLGGIAIGAVTTFALTRGLASGDESRG